MRKSHALWQNLLIIICAILISHFPGCTEKESSIKLGYGPFNSGLSLFVAQEKGFFTNHGIKVELVKYASANEMMNAMISGKIDGVQGMGFPTAFSVEANTPDLFKMFGLLGETDSNNATAFLVLNDSPISSINDLKGKKVGTYTGTTQLINLKVILQKLMDPDKDVEIIQVDKTLEVQALLAKQYDALLTVEPGVIAALSTGEIKVLVTNPRGKYIVNPFPAGAHCISNELIRKSPNLVKELISAIDEAVLFIRNDPTEAKATLTKYIPITADEAQKMGSYEWYTFDETLSKTAAIKFLADLYYTRGVISKELNIEKMMLRAKQ